MSIFFFTFGFLFEFSSYCSADAKKHQTAEQLHATGREIRQRNKEVAEGIAAFDAYYKARANNQSWNGPIPTLKPLNKDYDYFSDDHGDEHARKYASYEYDDRDDVGLEQSGRGIRMFKAADESGSFERLTDSERRSQERDGPRGAVDSEYASDKSYEG